MDASESPLPKGPVPAVLVFLLLLPSLLGIALRYSRIHETGIFFTDEGGYLMEARKIVRAVSAAGTGLRMMRENARQGLPRLRPDQKAVLQERVEDGWEQSYAKPLFSWTLAAAQALHGDRVWVGNWVSAITGAVTILLVGFLGRRLGGPRLGLLAAGCLACAYLPLHYSRSTYPESNYLLYFTASLLLLEWALELPDPPARRLLSTSLVLGLALLANYRALPVLVACVVLRLIVRRPAGFTRRHAMFLLAGFPVPILAMELIYYGLLLVSGGFGVFLVRASPFLILLRQLVFGGAQDYHFTAELVWYYPACILQLEGFLMPSLTLAGIVVLACRGRAAAPVRPYLAMLLPTFLLWCLIDNQQIRFLSSSLPLFALLAAFALNELLIWQEGKPMRTQIAAHALVGAALCANGLWACSRLPAPAPYAELSESLRQEGPVRIVTSSPAVMGYLLGRRAIDEHFPFDTLDPRVLAGRGITHVVLDFNIMGEIAGGILEKEAAIGREHAMAITPNLAAGHPTCWMDLPTPDVDNPMRSAGVDPRVLWSREHVRVYRLARGVP